MVEARRIISEKLREHQYREGYVRSLEGKGVEWDGDSDVEHMWEQVKQAMVESAWEVCGSVKVGGENPKSVWWSDKMGAAVGRREDAWKRVLVASDEENKERCMEAYTKKGRRVKRSIIQKWEDGARRIWKLF